MCFFNYGVYLKAYVFTKHKASFLAIEGQRIKNGSRYLFLLWFMTFISIFYMYLITLIFACECVSYHDVSLWLLVCVISVGKKLTRQAGSQDQKHFFNLITNYYTTTIIQLL